jgi:hypothetical protein
MPVERRVVGHEPAVHRLRRVHRNVGTLEQLGRVPAMVGIGHHADARLDVHDHAVELNRNVERDKHPPRNVLDIQKSADRGNQDRELVAAEAGDGVSPAKASGQPSGDIAEEPIALVVPQRVVDLLEPVEVE